MYREYCFEKNQVFAIAAGGETLVDAMVVATQANLATKMDSDQYHDWVVSWKKMYGDISKMIAYLRSTLKQTQNVDVISVIQITLNHMRMVANTLLNARQFARDSRRAARKLVTVH